MQPTITTHSSTAAAVKVAESSVQGSDSVASTDETWKWTQATGGALSGLMVFDSALRSKLSAAFGAVEQLDIVPVNRPDFLALAERGEAPRDIRTSVQEIREQRTTALLKEGATQGLTTAELQRACGSILRELYRRSKGEGRCSEMNHVLLTELCDRGLDKTRLRLLAMEGKNATGELVDHCVVVYSQNAPFPAEHMSREFELADHLDSNADGYVILDAWKGMLAYQKGEPKTNGFLNLCVKALTEIDPLLDPATVKIMDADILQPYYSSSSDLGETTEDSEEESDTNLSDSAENVRRPAKRPRTE